jgi:ATP-dependent Zn protease
MVLNTVKNFMWSYLLFFIGSGMGGIGILRHQQFEINAEEVQVTFDDVKGVRKCNMFCIFSQFD